MESEVWWSVRTCVESFGWKPLLGVVVVLVVVDPSSLMGWDGRLEMDMGSKRTRCCTNTSVLRSSVLVLVHGLGQSLVRCGWTREARPRRATVATAIAHLQPASAGVRLRAVNPSIPISP